MSLRARLLVGLAVVAVVLGLVTTWIYRTTETNLVRQVDEQLGRAVPREGFGEGPNPDAGLDAGGPSAMYVAVLTRTGLRTLYEPQLTEGRPGTPDLTAALVAERSGEGPFTITSIGADFSYRVQVKPEGRARVPVAYALPLEDVRDTLRRLLVVELGGSAAVLAVLGLVTFWVLRLGVRPVQEMTAAAAAIGQGDLSRRIPDAQPGTEAGELGTALNRMLGRIEDAFEERAGTERRLRQFVADASHELRTPVTTIRGYAELFRRGGLSDPSALSEAMRRTEQEAVRIGSLVEDLLHLARLDQGRPLELASVDLAMVLHDAAQDVRTLDPARPISVSTNGPVTIVGDDARIRQIVTNLITNARVHTEPGTPIRLTARADDSQVVVEVSDDGPGMAPEVAGRAFERFFRADPARARQTGGSGLGLSIVAATVEAHHGRVTIETAPGAGTAVRVVLPVTPPVVEAANQQLTEPHEMS